MTAHPDITVLEARVSCPGCDGAFIRPTDSHASGGFLPCIYCSGLGLVTARHAEAIARGRRLMRWVRLSGLPVMYFARAFGLDPRQIVDVMWAREAMPADLERSLAFFERTSPARFATELLAAGPEAISIGAKAMHDGPVGASDHAEFDSDRGKRASDWCRECLRTSLEAISVWTPARAQGADGDAEENF